MAGSAHQSLAGIEREHLQLNENSLWTGADQGDYGAHQMLEDLFLDFATGPAPVVTCPSGHDTGNAAEALEYSMDGDVNTKWCVETKGRLVIWQVAAVPGAQAATTYTLTSGNDLPRRDPRT